MDSEVEVPWLVLVKYLMYILRMFTRGLNRWIQCRIRKYNFSKLILLIFSGLCIVLEHYCFKQVTYFLKRIFLFHFIEIICGLQYLILFIIRILQGSASKTCKTNYTCYMCSVMYLKNITAVVEVLHDLLYTYNTIMACKKNPYANHLYFTPRQTVPKQYFKVIKLASCISPLTCFSGCYNCTYPLPMSIAIFILF